MPIVLYRVDERLIHGQVVVGWGNELRPDRYLVVDDELAASDWEQDLYRLGAGDAETIFAPVEAARASLELWDGQSPRSILLTRDVAAMARLAGGGRLEGSAVNLGGVHHAEGRREVLTYLHLSDEDREHLRALRAGGVRVSARDLPDSTKVPLDRLLDG